MKELVCLKDVTKSYESRLILKNINLGIHPGEFYLLLGRNGTGKSVLLKLIANLTLPTRGTVTRDDSAHIGYLGHDCFQYDSLTALENLRFWRGAYNKSFTDDELCALLEKMALRRGAGELAGNFSRGMKQRLNFCRLLLQTPDLLLLDEPFTGLDAASQELMRKELDNFRANGAAIVLVTHSPQTEGQGADARLEIRDKTLNAYKIA